MESLDLLFIPEIKFTERGSIILWRVLRDKLKIISFISTPEQLNGFLETLFKDITGFNIRDNEYVYVNELDNKKGISSGMVSIPWWRTIGFPVLVKRFAEGKSPFTNENDFIVEKMSKLKKPWVK